VAARRVFVALAPPAAACERLIAAARRALGAEERAWRLPHAAHLHLTLAFLGDVDEARFPELGATLARALAGRAAPRLVLRGTGAFPGWERPRVLWAGLAEEPGAEGRLAALHGALAAALDAARFARDEKPFAPHLTVARPRPGGRARVPSAFRSLALEEAWRAESVLWIESRLAQQGSERYPVLASYPLEEG
jgi:2'-5' RNA ligase